MAVVGHEFFCVLRFFSGDGGVAYGAGGFGDGAVDFEGGTACFLGFPGDGGVRFVFLLLCEGREIIGIPHAVFFRIVGLAAGGFTGFLYLQGVFFWRFVSTDSMKPGWFLPTTCVGGSAPLLGAPTAGVLGILAATGAFDFSKAGDAMANTIGHLWKPGRSVPRKHVVDVLLKTAIKSYVSSPVGGSAPDQGFRSSVARNTGRWLQGPECISYFYQGCLCMSCNHQNLK